MDEVCRYSIYTYIYASIINVMVGAWLSLAAPALFCTNVIGLLPQWLPYYIALQYRKYVEKDGALARRFQPILVEEPSVEDTVSILRGLKEKYEVHHGVHITDGAIVAAATLSNRSVAVLRLSSDSTWRWLVKLNVICPAGTSRTGFCQIRPLIWWTRLRRVCGFSRKASLSRSRYVWTMGRSVLW
jgi:hypothetical protein